MSAASHTDSVDSSAPWTQGLPPEWSVNTLGNVVDVVGGSTPSKENLSYWNGSIPWVSPKDMKRPVIWDSEDHVSDSALRSGSLRLVSPPAVLMVIRGMILAHTVPIGLTAAEVTVNQDIKALLPRSGLSAEFLAHLLRALNPGLLARVGEAGHGTKALRTELWRKLPIPIPPSGLQAKIVRFLDRKTAAIDALIAKKERLIELLQEKRQALITHAVTKGLDPSVPMKESGIEWLGAIPAHWVARRLKQIARRVVVGIAQAATHAYVDDGIPIIRSTNLRANRLELGDLLHIERGFADQLRSKYIRPGDLLTVRTGNAGATAVVPESLPLSQCFTMLITTLEAAHCPQFFSYQLNSHAVATYFEAESWGTAQANISVPILQNAPVAVPPPAEQKEILARIQVALEAVERPLAHACKQVDLLREYRQSLITAAVTGKLEIPPEE